MMIPLVMFDSSNKKTNAFNKSDQEACVVLVGDVVKLAE